MVLHLKRSKSTEDSTIGILNIKPDNQNREYLGIFTLEDVVRPEKIHGKTAIPAGTYDVIIRYSPKFKRLMPAISKVPGFTGILIHAGNTSTDTEGCILVGFIRDGNSIFYSRAAFDFLFAEIKAAINGGESVKITIENCE